MTPLLAFTIGVPGMLWGMGLASAPLIIHLLNRRRFKEINWAAMQWLLEAVKKNSRRIQIEQWLLLAIRTLILLLVAMAMARPTLESAAALFSADTSATHHIIVLDNSMSMHYSALNQSRWERAKSLAASVLDEAQKGDLASVVLMGNPATVLVGDPSPYLTAVAAEIEAVKPQHAEARVAPAIDKVAELLKISRAARRRVYLITDMQKIIWVGSDASTDTAELGGKLQAIGKQAQFNILDVGGESANLAVIGLEQVDPVVVAGRQTVFRATIANFSSSPSSSLAAEILVDGQVEATERVSIPPGEQRAVAFAVGFRKPGQSAVEVRIPDDGLRLDNSRWLSVQVRQSLAVLAIDGEPSGQPFRSETDYLRIALAPGDDDQPSLIRVDTRLESELLEAKLDDYDLVVLANVGQWTESEVSVLESFVKRGGGLAIFVGKQTNLDAYNRVLFKEGKGLLPAKLASLVGDPNRPQSFFNFDPLEYKDPIIRPFQNAEQAGLLTTKIYRYIKAELPAESKAKVVLGYQKSSDPALMIGAFGRGNVALITTSADLDWNTWAISPSYVPVMQELARHLVSGRLQRPAVLAGEPIVAPAPRNAADTPVTVTPPPPDAAAAPSKIEPRDGIDSLVYTGTDRVGVYQAAFGPPIDEKWLFAVNSWPAESDLARWSADDLRTTFPGWEFTISDRVQSTKVYGAASAIGQGEFHRALLALALTLLFVETFLAWKFGHHQ